MKKILIVVFSAMALLALAGCASTKFIDATYDVQVTVNGPDVADIVVAPTFAKDYAMGRTMSNMSNNRGTYCYDIAVYNKTDDVLFVNWEKSAIYYNGISSYVMINNQAYFDRNSPMPSMMVPPDEVVLRTIISSDQPRFQSGSASMTGWLVNVLPTFNTQLVLCLESSQGESFYIFNVNGAEV